MTADSARVTDAIPPEVSSSIVTRITLASPSQILRLDQYKTP
jgi:hypothetical protein